MSWDVEPIASIYASVSPLSHPERVNLAPTAFFIFKARRYPIVINVKNKFID